MFYNCFVVIRVLILQGNVCGSDGNVEWAGNLADGSCDIEIVKLKESDHEGEWTCSMTTDRTLRDSVDLELKRKYILKRHLSFYAMSVFKVITRLT